MSFFSVIIPNYNHDKYLKQRIDSVLDQSFNNFEVVILDDASTDESKKIIESYRKHPRIKQIHYNLKNSGSPFKQWQKGIDVAESSWVWIAESDDVANVKFLETAFKAIQHFPNISLFYCDALAIDDQSNSSFHFSCFKNDLFKTDRWSRDYIIDGKQEIDQFLKYYCTINNASSMVFKKESIRSLNAFHLNYHGDWLFYLELLSGSKVYYSSTVLNMCRQHSGGLTSSKLDQSKRKIDYFKILDYIIHRDFVTDHQKLCDYFIKNYLGGGILSDVFTTKTAFFEFYKINKILAISILVRTLKLRIKDG